MAIPNTLKPYLTCCHVRAKKYAHWAGRSRGTAGVLAFFVTITPTSLDMLGWWAVLVATILVVGQRVLEHFHHTSHVRGEAIKRQFLLAEGFGTEISEIDLSQLRKEFGLLPDDPEPFYYSTCPPGERRLLELTLESAWWTEHLQRKASERFWWLAFISSGGFIILLVMIVYLMASAQISDLMPAKGALSIISLLVALDFWGKWWSYRNSSGDCLKSQESCWRILRLQDISCIDSIGPFSEYYSVTLSSPAVPESVYWKNRDFLNEQWKTIEHEIAGLRQPKEGAL